MKPTKGKTYYIDYPGHYGYDRYHGKAVCTKDTKNKEGWYAFKLLGAEAYGYKGGDCFFESENVICCLTKPAKSVSKKKKRPSKTRVPHS